MSKLVFAKFPYRLNGIILRQFQNLSLPKILLYRANRPALHFLPNDPIRSRSTGGHLGLSSINNRRTATIFVRFAAIFPVANLSPTSLPSIFWKYSKTFDQQPENIQTFHQHTKIFRLFRLQICLSRKSSTLFRKFSKIFWAAATSSSNQQ